jgi:formylglycine-generating enzyme required for sulfatase activity
MHPVGTLKPNGLGLFDMHGNALEWCQDRYYRVDPAPGDAASTDSEDKRDIKDILDSDESNSRVLRGGAFNLRTSFVRSASHYGNAPAVRLVYVGFRPARTFTP